MEEEIKIYRSAWKNVLLSLCNFAFVVISVLILFSENKKPGFDIVAWIGILFFGLGGLLIAYDIFKGQVTRTPFLIITDKKVTINSWRSWGGGIVCRCGNVLPHFSFYGQDDRH